MKTDYEKQAQDFLNEFGIKFRATLSDSKPAPWANDDRPAKAEPHHYRVTLSKAKPIYRLYEEIAELPKFVPRLTFDFWGSIADAEKMAQAQSEMKELEGMLAIYNSRKGSAPGAISQCESKWKIAAQQYKEAHASAYDVLACISGDVNCPETFEDFCSEYGYETNSIKALQTFRRASSFGKRLRAFFTESEIEKLQEIQ